MAIPCDDDLFPADPRFEAPFVQTSWELKRGKTFPVTRGSWGMRDANGREHDPDMARRVLDEALR